MPMLAALGSQPARSPVNSGEVLEPGAGATVEGGAQVDPWAKTQLKVLQAVRGLLSLHALLAGTQLHSTHAAMQGMY